MADRWQLVPQDFQKFLLLRKQFFLFRPRQRRGLVARLRQLDHPAERQRPDVVTRRLKRRNRGRRTLVSLSSSFRDVRTILSAPLAEFPMGEQILGFVQEAADSQRL